MFILTSYNKDALSDFSDRVEMIRTASYNLYFVKITPAEYAYCVIKYEPTHVYNAENTKGLHNTFDGWSYSNDYLYNKVMQCTT